MTNFEILMDSAIGKFEDIGKRCISTIFIYLICFKNPAVILLFENMDDQKKLKTRLK